MTEDEQRSPRDQVLVPARPVTARVQEHRRGVIEGLVASLVLVLLAGAGGLLGRGPVPPVPREPSASPGAAIPSAAPGATDAATDAASPASPRPTFLAVPEIGVGVDHVLESLMDPAGPGVLTTGDRLVVGLEPSDTAIDQPFAYDPEAGLVFRLPPEPASYTPLLTSGSVVVGSVSRETGDAATGAQTGLVIHDVEAGTNQSVWPSSGYDALEPFGLAAGFAFGQMVRHGPGADGGRVLQDGRAIVVDLATGQLRDLTPPGFSSPGLAQVHGLAQGRALVATFPGANPGSRSVDVLELVDLATGDRTTPAIPVDDLRFGAVSEAGDLGQLRLDGDLVVGQLRPAPDGPLAAFAYRIATRSLEVLPNAAPGNTRCPFQLDPGRLVCYQAGAPSSPGAVFVYDVNRHMLTPIPTPGLTRSVVVAGVANGQVVLQELEAVPSGPLVWDAASRLVYRLDAGLGLPPGEVAVIGRLVLDPATAQVWRLP